MPASANRFTGHGSGGIVLLIMSTWWMISIFRRYFQQLSKNQPYYSTTWYPAKSCSKFPLEPFLKLIALVGYNILTWHDFIKSMVLDDGMAATTGPHAVFVGMYVFVPIAELLQHYKCTVLGGFENASFAAQILALLAGVIAFGFHIHGRMVVDVHVHKILDMSSAIMLTAAIFEFKDRNSVMVSLLKAFSFFITGLWTISVAFIVNSQIDWIPIWDLKKMDNVTLATCLYVFLMMFTILYMSLIACIVGRPYKQLLLETQAKCCGTSTNGIANGGKTV